MNKNQIFFCLIAYFCCLQCQGQTAITLYMDENSYVHMKNADKISEEINNHSIFNGMLSIKKNDDVHFGGFAFSNPSNRTIPTIYAIGMSYSRYLGNYFLEADIGPSQHDGPEHGVAGFGSFYISSVEKTFGSVEVLGQISYTDRFWHNAVGYFYLNQCFSVGFQSETYQSYGVTLQVRPLCTTNFLPDLNFWVGSFGKEYMGGITYLHHFAWWPKGSSRSARRFRLFPQKDHQVKCVRAKL
jgi:hypothetical protein